jgi:hypothetical protein
VATDADLDDSHCLIGRPHRWWERFVPLWYYDLVGWRRRDRDSGRELNAALDRGPLDRDLLQLLLLNLHRMSDDDKRHIIGAANEVLGIRPLRGFDED